MMMMMMSFRKVNTDSSGNDLERFLKVIDNDACIATNLWQ